mgnify:CR=1 FL=1
MSDSALRHIPHVPATPGFGHTLQFLRDPYALHRRSRAACGPIYRTRILGMWRVTLGGPDAVDHVLRDPDRIFSSAEGNDILHPIFTGGLPVRDFDDHRAHRRIMQAAFRRTAMEGYVRRIVAQSGAMVDSFPVGRPFRFAPAIKEAVLDMGGQVLMGLEVGSDELRALNALFIDEVNGCMGIVRRPLPFTRMRRGLRAKADFEARMRALIPERRRTGGADFFSQMCRARDEDGAGWTEQEIVEHFNFLLLAGHDTSASALSSTLWGVAGAAPEWQDALAEEAATAHPRLMAALEDGDTAAMQAALADMPRTEWALKEALRLYPPAPFVSRRALRGFTWDGVTIPEGTQLSVPLAMVMVDPDLWREPERFDPARFDPTHGDAPGHPGAWVPFGGGAHKCIGMHFAYHEVKVVLAALLARYRVELPGPAPRWTFVPVARPLNGLPVILHPR